jgi:predicted SnoaL-like aldol condensation-catalyzing enzyme
VNNRLPLRACALLLTLASAAYAQEPPKPVADQRALLSSPDPKLAANKKLVFDMYRTVVNAGHWDQAEKFFTKEYYQHNPNVKSGRDALVDYIRKTRPVIAIPDQITFPVISIIAEGDKVMVASLEYHDDPEQPGKRYITSHFDLYRIENGLVAEHWDNVQKSADAMTKNPNITNSERGR